MMNWLGDETRWLKTACRPSIDVYIKATQDAFGRHHLHSNYTHLSNAAQTLELLSSTLYKTKVSWLYHILCS